MESLDTQSIIRYIRIVEDLQQESSEVRQAFRQYCKTKPPLCDWFKYEIETNPTEWDIINSHPQYKEIIDWWFERASNTTIPELDNLPYFHLLPGLVKLQDTGWSGIQTNTETQSERNICDSLIPFFLRERKRPSGIATRILNFDLEFSERS